MKLLADAHISNAVLRFLREEGHDCVHAELLQRGMPDDELLRLAIDQERIVLTADKDFGELVFRNLLRPAGVILLRVQAPSEADRLELFKKHWPVIQARVLDHFVVVTNRSVRLSPLPNPSA